MDSAHKKFIKYVRTEMIFSLRFRSPEDQMKPVHIAANVITERFFPYPKYNRIKEIQSLCDSGEIKITQEGNAYFYEALKPGGYDLNLLHLKAIPKDKVTQEMFRNIQKVSLPVDAPSTPYFDLFLKYRDAKPGLFFKVDNFSGRVHTPISSFHRTHRPNILLENEITGSIDVATMQPLLLGKILYNAIGKNEYSIWINEGNDVYIKLQNRSSLASRDEAKEKFFEILFSKPNDDLKELFGGADWINWINEYKQAKEPANPHNKDKPHSNLAWLLQNTEVKIMRQVWEKLVIYNLPFLSVHDEIIIKEKDFEQANNIFHGVLSKEFVYHKLNIKKQSEPKIKLFNEKVELLETTITHIEPTPPETDFKPLSKQFTQLWDITELETYFNAVQLPKRPIRLDQCSTINNVRNFIDSHIEIAKHNNGNSTFLPYLTRLQALKQYLK
jgi:hypothetical protein